MEKIILLDIDGVIAPVFSVDYDCHLVDIQWTKFMIPERIANFIRDISNLVTVTWASSWEESSYAVSQELNFNIAKHLTFQSISNDWFKIEGYKKFIEINQDKEILIIDDEICEFISNFELYKNLEIICPDDRIGLSDKDMNKVQNWLTI